VHFYFQSVLNGLIAGCVYALLASGLTLVYGVLNFINFAHGELIMLGAYLALFFMAGPFHLPFILSVPFSLCLTSMVAIGIDRAVFRHLRRAAPLTLLVAALGISFFLRNSVQFFWGAQIRTFEFEPVVGWRILNLAITPTQVAIVVTSAMSLLLLHGVLQKTKVGKAMRACSDNLELSMVTGIHTDRVILWMWIFAASLAALGGVLIAVDTNLEPGMGLINLIKAFAAILLGGVGNVGGAIVGAMVIGISENVGIWFISPGYKDGIAFAIMILTLLIRPAGIFGRK
jgi:branched-chain amino acid transport system permease protein/neutral amino acid transport system permease protein